MPHDIPIVGLPFKVKYWFPIAIVECQCNQDGEKMLVEVVNLMRGSPCPRCGNVYVIQGLTPQNRVLVNMATSQPPAKGN